MPFGPFYSQEQKDEINAAYRKRFGKDTGSFFDGAKGGKYDVGKPQAEKKQRIDRAARNLATPTGHELWGAAGMMSGRTKPRSTPKPQESTNPERPVQPTGGSPIAALPNDYKATELEAAQTAETYRSGSGNSPSGRGETRTNAKGVVQTGTSTGVKSMTLGDANALLTDGYEIQDPFSSIQLPTTGSSLYQKPPETNIFEQNPQYNISTESNPIKLSTNIFESGSALEIKDVGDKYQVSSDTAPPQSKSGSDLARRRAFLDGNVGSMQALRNAEATQGLTYAGGQHYIRKGEEFHALDKDTVRGYKSGTVSPQDILNKHINAVTETNNQSPQTEQPAAVSPIDLTSPVPEGFNPDIKLKTKLQIPYNK